jgi:phage repressor protein C with HTH and peptisase S24 domain
MPKTFKEIFYEEYKKRFKVQREAAAAIGISQQQVAKYLKGKDYPKLDAAAKIADAFGVSVDYLAGRFPQESPSLAVRETTSTYSSKSSGDPRLPQGSEADFVRVPIVEAKIAAGPAALVTSEQIIDVAFVHRRILKKKDPRNLICTFVKGNSMEPILRDGAIVCIDTKARPEGKKVPPGTIWAVRKDDGVVVKYLQIRDHTLVLVSENKAYDVELVKDPEAIVGRVVWAWQNY